jgi:hypothetical protein
MCVANAPGIRYFFFRVEFGSVPSVWKHLATVLDRVVKDGLDPEQVEQLMFIFRIIRNSAAGVNENQDQARYGAIKAKESEGPTIQQASRGAFD